MNYSKLRGRIREQGLTESELADKVNLSRTSLSFRLNNKCPWKMDEVLRVCKVLSIPIDKAWEYFFKQ